MDLPTDFWVAALLRRVEQAGGFATVSRKGDARYGSVLIKVLNQRTRDAKLYRQARQGEETVWMRPIETVNEPDLDAYITRQVGYDSDLWVIEIEDTQGRTFLTEKVVE